MNQLSDAEKQLLDAILSLTMFPNANEEEEDENFKQGDKLPATKENLHKRGRLIQEQLSHRDAVLKDWTDTYEGLIRKGLIRCDGIIFSLTDQGNSQAHKIRRERSAKRFSDTMIRMDRSKAYSSFCERVFGKNLCQANVMDTIQLESLLNVLNLTAENKVLDMGCGIGKIAEYISDTTNAYVLGIDIASEAIKRAQERTCDKRDRLEFRVEDMNDLSFTPNNIDTVISIATLHYLDDIVKTIDQMKNLLSPKGQMGLFSFQYRSSDDPPDILLPENTKLGQVLKKQGLSFQTWDYTKREQEIRYRQLEVGNELREAFRSEGNLDLCEDRIEESEIDLELLENGKKCSYLYYVQLQG